VTENGNAVYHAGAIGYLAGQLSDHDDAWRTWFAANRIEPLTIVYEELAADTTGVTAEVIDHLGVGPVEIPEPPLRRQGDDRSARWVERYRA
jgi:LPS sulfotransferase NodH